MGPKNKRTARTEGSQFNVKCPDRTEKGCADNPTRDAAEADHHVNVS